MQRIAWKGSRLISVVPVKRSPSPPTTGATGMRTPAAEIEGLVAAQIASLLADPIGLCTRLEAPLQPGCIDDAIERGKGTSEALLGGRGPTLVTASTERIELALDRITMTLYPGVRLSALGIGAEPDRLPSPLTITLAAALKRSGRARKLSIAGADLPLPRRADPTLLKALQRAHRWWAMLNANSTLSIPALATSEGVTDSYVDRILRLAFLAPDIVEQIVCGAQPVGLDLERLRAIKLPLLWSEQRTLLRQ